jgi:hypothetical protein
MTGLLCRLGFHPNSLPVRYLGMTTSKRTWYGRRIYKAFLDRFRCPSCNREYERWS